MARHVELREALTRQHLLDPYMVLSQRMHCEMVVTTVVRKYLAKFVNTIKFGQNLDRFYYIVERCILHLRKMRSNKCLEALTLTLMTAQAVKHKHEHDARYHDIYMNKSVGCSRVAKFTIILLVPW